MGCLNAQASAQKQKLSAKTAKKYAKKIGGSSGATNGLSSTVAFTPLQVCILTLPALLTLQSFLDFPQLHRPMQVC